MAKGYRLVAPAPPRRLGRAAQILTAGLMLGFGSGASAETGFDKSVWQPPMGYGEHDPRRQDMLPYALARLSPGQTSAKVSATLGSPEAAFASEWVYYLGQSGDEDSKVLIVFFNGDGLLVSAREFQGAAYSPPDAPPLPR